jgi:hypothetical protein
VKIRPVTKTNTAITAVAIGIARTVVISNGNNGSKSR